MAKITKTEEQLTKDLEVAMKKLYKTLPGTQEEKVQILRTKFEGELQQLIQPKQSEEMKAIIDLLRQLKPHAEIAEKYSKTSRWIGIIAQRNGIYSPKAVRQLLKTPEAAKITNQDLAEKTGAYPDAIERIRKEIKQEEQERESKRQSKKKEKEEPSEEMKAIIDLLRQLKLHAEIAKKYGKSHGYISAIAKNNGISSPKAVRELLKTPEAAKMTNQDLAEKTGAYPDAIERIRKEIEKEEQERENKRQSKKKEKPEPSEEMKAIIDLLKQLKPHAEIANQYSNHHSYISAIANKNEIWSPKAVRQELKQESSKALSNEELATKMGVYPDAIERVRQEIEKEEQERESKRQSKKKEKPEPSEEMKAIIDLLKQLKPHAEIAEKYSKTSRRISIIAQQNGIYSPKAVRQLLKAPEAAKMTNQDLAEKTGAYPEAIERIRKEIEQERQKREERPTKKSKEKRMNRVQSSKPETIESQEEKKKDEPKVEKKERKIKRTEEPKVNRVEQGKDVTVKSTAKTVQTSRPIKRIDTTEFFEMAKQATDVRIIAERLGASRGKVSLYLSQYGFWERRQVVEVLDNLSDEQIAAKSKLSIEAIKEIRAQEQAKAERRSSEPIQNNRLAIQRREDELRAKEQKSFLQKAEKYASIQKWEDRTGVSKYKIVRDLRRLRNANIASQHQLKLLREWEEENIARVPHQRRMANLRIAWGEYQSKVRNINGYNAKTAKSMVHFNIEKLLALYEDLLTQGQYAYLCYGYIKTEKELQALKLGKEKLGLKEETLLALRKKIEEIQAQEIEKSQSEGPTDGAGGER